MFLAVFYGLVPILLLIALIYGGIAIGIRREPDPTGARPHAIYLTSVVFIAIVAGLVSLAGVGAKTVDLIVHDEGATGTASPESCTTDPSGGIVCVDGGSSGEFEFSSVYPGERTRDKSALFNFGVVLLVSLALLRWHWGRLTEFRRGQDFSTGPARATYTAYLYLTAFTGLAVLVTAGVVIVLGLGDVIFPSGLNSGPTELVRDAAYSQIVSALLSGTAALMLLRYHWREAAHLREDAGPPSEPAPA